MHYTRALGEGHQPAGALAVNSDDGHQPAGLLSPHQGRSVTIGHDDHVIVEQSSQL